MTYKRVKGKRLTYFIIAIGCIVLVASGVALYEKALEQYYIGKLDSEDKEQRKLAAEKLGEMESVRAIPRLTELFRTETHEGAHLPYSAKALIKIGEPAVLALCKLLGEERLTNRRDFIWTIGAIGEQAGAAVPYLIESLEDENWVVRVTAAEVLGFVGPKAKDAIPALAETLKDENESVRSFAAEAIKKIQVESSDGHER